MLARTRPDPGDPIGQVTAELKMQARSTVSLCFSLLSEIHSSRREMMWKIQVRQAHFRELADARLRPFGLC